MRSHTLPSICYTFVLSLLLALTPLPCSSHEGHSEAFKTTNIPLNLNHITLTKAGEEAIGLKTITLQPSSLKKVLRVTGSVEATEQGHADLSVPITGTVIKVLVREGDQVKKGQPLLTLQSTEALALLNTLLEKEADLERDIQIQTNTLEITQLTFEQENTLFEEGISSRRDYQAAKAAYNTAKVTLQATQTQRSTLVSTTKNQFRLMGLSTDAIDHAIATGQATPNLTVSAPISGVIAFRNVTPGDTLSPEKKLLSIVQRQPVWIVLEIFQNNTHHLQSGMAVDLEIPSGEKLTGIVNTIGPVVDPKKRTVPVWILSQNKDHLLMPGMTITAKVVYGKAKANVLVLPTQALVTSHGQRLVYVKHDSHYAPVVVQTGLETASEVEITQGLQKGDTVVVRGADQLLAQAVLSKNSSHEHSHHHDAHHHHHNNNSRSLSIPPFWQGLGLGLLLALLIGGGFWFYRTKGGSRV